MESTEGAAAGINRRAALLREIVELTRGRIDESLTDEAEAWLGAAIGRLTLGGDNTVVAVAGATGSGKSSVFNALTGLDIAAVGVRRPTTSWAMACVWGSGGAQDVLGWLGIPPRHQVMRGSSLDEQESDGELDGLVLLDLPDHDSTEVEHHVEMARLVAASDVIVWVVDPQKYADAAIHDRFLRPLADHAAMMIVAFNHIDEVPDDRRESLLSDLRHLLDDDGMPEVPMLATSATEGWGIDELRGLIAERVAAKRAVTDKLNADLTTFAVRIQQQNGAALPGQVARAGQVRLVQALEDAAGVSVLADAVRSSRRHHLTRFTRWPLIAWAGAGRGDKKARAGAGTLADPRPVPVERSRVDAAVRETADEVGHRLPEPWARVARRSAEEILPRVGDELDAALGAESFAVSEVGGGWRALRVLQWALLLTALVGLGWWIGGLAGWISGTVEYLGQPVSLWLAAGAALLGLVVAVVFRLVATARAASFARRCRSRLEDVVTDIADRLVVTPLEEQVSGYRRSREALLELVGSRAGQDTSTAEEQAEPAQS